MCLNVSSMSAKNWISHIFRKEVWFLADFTEWPFFGYYACVMKLVAKNSNSLSGKYAASRSQYGKWLPRPIFIHCTRYIYKRLNVHAMLVILRCVRCMVCNNEDFFQNFDMFYHAIEKYNLFCFWYWRQVRLKCAAKSLFVRTSKDTINTHSKLIKLDAVLLTQWSTSLYLQSVSLFSDGYLRVVVNSL